MVLVPEPYRRVPYRYSHGVYTNDRLSSGRRGGASLESQPEPVLELAT